MTGYIYKITSPSNKSYIGQTAYLVRRINQYRNFQWRNYDSRIYNSLRKHGFESHKFEILSEIEIDDINLLRLTLDELEVFFIEVYDTFNNGLNSTTGGTYGSFCEDSLKKKSKSMKGKKRNATEEGLASQKRKAKEWRDSLTEEEKKKMHDSKRGKPISDEQKAKMSKTFRENFINITKEEHERRYSHNNKPVVVYDLNMNPLYEFESILKCCNYFNDKNIKLNKSHIGAVCNGIRKTHLGFLFRFRTN